MSIGNCTSCVSRFSPLAHRNEGASGIRRESERLLVATASQQSDASLRVVTDDGDVVTLSAHRESTATYTDYRRHARGPGGSERQRIQVFEASSQQSFSIEIEGTLDDEERADLEALIQRVATSFRRFEQGDDAGARSLLSGGGDLDSLESFSVEFERQQTVTVAQMMRRTQEIGEREEFAAPTPRQGQPTTLPVTPGIAERLVTPRPLAEPVPVEPIAAEPVEAEPRSVQDRHSHHRGSHAKSMARAAHVLDQMLERLASRAPAFDAGKAIEAIRAALTQPTPGDPAPTPVVVPDQPILVNHLT